MMIRIYFARFNYHSILVAVLSFEVSEKRMGWCSCCDTIKQRDKSPSNDQKKEHDEMMLQIHMRRYIVFYRLLRCYEYKMCFIFWWWLKQKFLHLVIYGTECDMWCEMHYCIKNGFMIRSSIWSDLERSARTAFQFSLTDSWWWWSFEWVATD